MSEGRQRPPMDAALVFGVAAATGGLLTAAVLLLAAPRASHSRTGKLRRRAAIVGRLLYYCRLNARFSEASFLVVLETVIVVFRKSGRERTAFR